MYWPYFVCVLARLLRLSTTASVTLPAQGQAMRDPKSFFFLSSKFLRPSDMTVSRRACPTPCLSCVLNPILRRALPTPNVVYVQSLFITGAMRLLPGRNHGVPGWRHVRLQSVEEGVMSCHGGKREAAESPPQGLRSHQRETSCRHAEKKTKPSIKGENRGKGSKQRRGKENERLALFCHLALLGKHGLQLIHLSTVINHVVELAFGLEEVARRAVPVYRISHQKSSSRLPLPPVLLQFDRRG